MEKAEIYPFDSFSIPDTGHSTKMQVHELESREAAIGDLTFPAISRPWRLHLNFWCQVESNGWFSAIKLIARISGSGRERKFNSKQ